MSTVEHRAAFALAWVVFAGGCAPERPATLPSPTPSMAAAAAATASANVEARLLRLKAELALTPRFCSLENRPCRAQRRAVIERGVDALLARCASRPARTFDRCLASELPAVLRELPSPAPEPVSSTGPATAASAASARPPTAP